MYKGGLISKPVFKSLYSVGKTAKHNLKVCF